MVLKYKFCIHKISVRSGYTLMSVAISITNKYVVENPIVTVKCRTAIKVLFLYIKMCLSNVE